jgi:hypothetical protein
MESKLRQTALVVIAFSDNLTMSTIYPIYLADSRNETEFIKGGELYT